MTINEAHPRGKDFVLWGHCQNILDDPRIGIRGMNLEGTFVCDRNRVEKLNSIVAISLYSKPV